MPEKFLKEITPREYQKKIFETCKEKNCLVVIPTGLGKTLIALMLTIERMKKFPKEKILFLAPTKPLAEQHLAYFKKHLSELFADMQLFTGAINSEKRKKIWKTSYIIFSTPQCVANDIKKSLYNLENVSLLIEDEAHRCIKNYDYNFIAQKYKTQAKNQRILGLTASPGSEPQKIKQICENLSIQEVEIRERESEDVKKYLQELEFEKIKVNFPSEFEEIRQILLNLFNKYVSELKSRQIFWGIASKTNLIKLQKEISKRIRSNPRNFNYLLSASSCAQAIKIQHALELLETQTLQSFHKYLKELFKQAADKKSKGVIRLTSTPEIKKVYSKTEELIKKNKEHPKIEKLIELIKTEKQKNQNIKLIIFTQFRDTASIIEDKIKDIPGIKSSIFVGQTIKEGKGMNQKKQREIIKKFSQGEINVLCATCIAEEGLDIPEVNAVIFYEPIPSIIRTIQRAGRTARLMKGKLIILITQQTRDESFYYISRARSKKMSKAIKEVKEKLNEKKIQKELF